MKITKRGQSSVEVILLFGFMFLIFNIFTIVIIERIIEINEYKNQEMIYEVGSVIAQDIKLAAMVEDGYSRIIEVPRKIAGMNYSIKIIPGRLKGINSTSDLVLAYTGRTFLKSYETIFSLPRNIEGNISHGSNVISKINNTVYIQPIS